MAHLLVLIRTILARTGHVIGENPAIRLRETTTPARRSSRRPSCGSRRRAVSSASPPRVDPAPHDVHENVIEVGDYTYCDDPEAAATRSSATTSGSATRH